MAPGAEPAQTGPAWAGAASTATAPEGNCYPTGLRIVYTGYSRPDAFLKAWKRAGLPVYKAPSGRNRVTEADL